MTNKLFAFSGRIGVGKNWVALQACLEERGFADPIYELAKWMTGTCDKSVPGIRKLLQDIGQTGWNCNGADHPWTPNRIFLLDKIKSLATMDDAERKFCVPEFNWVDWTSYGERQDFWVRILLDGLKQKPLAPNRQGVGIVNVRFDHELEPLNNHGFKHFHVMASESTRLKRMQAKGYPVIKSEQEDISEAFARQMDDEMPANRVIWNDSEPMPEGKRYLTVVEFLAFHKLDSTVIHATNVFSPEFVGTFETDAGQKITVKDVGGTRVIQVTNNITREVIGGGPGSAPYIIERAARTAQKSTRFAQEVLGEPWMEADDRKIKAERPPGPPSAPRASYEQATLPARLG